MAVSHYTDIFAYVTSMESAYAQPIMLNDKAWSMKDHIKKSELYNNSDIMGQKTDFTPIKNITRPILNLQHRTEDIEVKDVQIYVDDPDNFHLSFLVKKYHDDVFVQENDIDTYFDELNNSRIDFGAGLSKQLNKPCPEVVPLQQIAFCDQTDILSGPIGLKHFYSPDQLLGMGSKGWGNTANGATATLEEVITLSREEKEQSDKQGAVNKVPGRYIEVYEVHGNLPKRFADQSDTSEKYETRLYIVCFYQKKGSQDKQGIILYTAPEKESPFKIIKRDPVYGRALGFGGAEELFEAQTWVNYDMIRMQDMLDSAAKTVLTTDDPSIAAKHPSGLKNLENLEIIERTPGTTLEQVNTFPKNIELFTNSVAQWEAHAQQMGAANDSIMGDTPSAGTPFKLQELVTQESHGLHDYRRGQLAKHLEEVYKDWIIPHIEKKICESHRFLSELSTEDMQWVTARLSDNAWHRFSTDKVLSGQDIHDGDKEAFLQQFKEQLQKKGNKHFIEILKGEFKGLSLGVKVSIKGKSKDLSAKADKLSNIFGKIFANPQGFVMTMQIPGAAKAFTNLLEASGLEPQDFSDMSKAIEMMKQQQQPQPSPMQPQGAPQPQNA